jgi:hypothetical protein
MVVERPPPEPPPRLWRCIDFENTERISEHEDRRGRYVPLWVIGADPRTPEQMFGNVGRPTPKPPRSGPGAPPGAPAAEPMVWVEDKCVALGPVASCALLFEEREGLETKIYNSVSSDKQRLQQRLQDLDVRLAQGCAH